MVGALAAVAVIAAGGLFYLRSEQPVSQGQLSAVATTATATTIKKNLSVTPVGSEETLDIPETALVSGGDTLATSDDGRGIVEMEDGSTVVLDYDSSMVIQNLDASATHTGLTLAAGSVWARVKKVFGQGEYVEIKTKNAVAAVRGTSFGLTYRKDGSSVLLVSEGTVALTPRDLVTGEEKKNKTLMVSAGRKGVVSPDGAISVSLMTAADTSSEWFRYNNPEDSTAPAASVAPAPSPTPTPATSQTAPQTSPTASSENEGNICASFSETGGGAQGSTLALSSVSPSSVSRNSGTTVTLTGEGLVCATTITIGGTVLNGETGFVVVNNTNITFSSSQLPVGTFDIVIADTLGARVTLPQALTITQ